MRDTIIEFARAIPATFQLVYRLVRDDRIDQRKRVAVLGALAYAALPFDIIPDRFPMIGRVDDLVICAAALQALFDAAGEELLAEHWTAGEESLRGMQNVVEAVAGLVPKPLRRMLGRAR